MSRIAGLSVRFHRFDEYLHRTSQSAIELLESHCSMLARIDALLRAASMSAKLSLVIG